MKIIATAALFLAWLTPSLCLAGDFSSRLKLDVQINNLKHHCERDHARVYFGRFEDAERLEPPSILRCHQDYREEAPVSVDTNAATWLTLKRGRTGEPMRMVGLGVRFQTGQGYTQLRLRGRRLSLMYRAEF